MTNTVFFPGLGLEFELNRVAFTIFGHNIYWYGVIIACGFLLAVAYGLYITPRFGMDPDKVTDAIFVVVPMAIIGARLYYVIFNPAVCFNADGSFSLLKMIAFWDGGLAIYGGVIATVVTALRQKALDHDGRVLDAQASVSYRACRKLFLSENRDLDQTVMWTTAMVAVMASRGQEIKMAYRPFSNLGGAEVLDEMDRRVEKVADDALELLESQPIAPGEYECVCDPETTGMIVHEAFGHGVEMDMFVKDRALARECVGEYVASRLVTMHDGSAVDEAATMFFDDEGTLTGDTVVIDKGVLKTGMCDALSAARLGTAPTGNGRRESYERKAYTRMTNTYFQGGSSTPEELIASVKDGFLLEQPSSGMEDPKNWGIQCMVTTAREIKDGKLTGKLFSPIVLTGYVPDLLKSVTMMSKTPVLSGSGYCGKGYKEWVKVSDGGPYMKARIRLG